jgi:hypothetical protein
MSLEPEKPIESLLRRYARKRRERTGDSWPVPPATRRSLQQEVARKLARNSATRGSWFDKLFVLDWLRPIGAMTSVAILILGAWLVFGKRADRSIKPEFSSVGPSVPPTSAVVQLAANDKTAASEADSLKQSTQMTESRNSERLLQESESSKAVQSPAPSENRFGQDNRDLKAPATSLEAAAQNPINKPGTSLGANVATSAAAPAQDLALDSSAAASGVAAALTSEKKTEAGKSASLAHESLAIKAAAAQGSAVSKEMTQPGQSATNVVQLGLFAGSQAIDLATTEAQPLARGLSAPTTRFAAARRTEVIKQVLTSFRVEQAGRELRVIDSDGSVYAGPILGTNDPATSVLQVSSASLDNSQKAGRLAGSGGNVAKPKTLEQAVFQVTGTNKSLNRRVVFSGTLSTNQNFGARNFNLQTAAGIGGALKDVQTNGQSEDVRLSGTALIEGEQPIRIEAESAGR